MNKEKLKNEIETKTKELDVLKSKILYEIEETKKNELEIQKTKLEDEIKTLQKQLDSTVDETKKETKNLKDEINVDNDQTYELIKGSKMYNKLTEIGKTEAEIKEFAENIDKVVRKFLDQELVGFPNNIKNSMSVGIQFAMMETLTAQGANGSAEFFTAFSGTETNSGTHAFEGLYKAFGKLGSANKFYILANKVQNITWYLSDKKNIINTSKSIPELMNPAKFKTLLEKPIRSNQKELDKLDINTILSIDSTTGVDLSDDEIRALKNIVDNDKIPITAKIIESIQKSLKTADKLLDTREKFQDKASDLLTTISGVLDINIPFFGNLGEIAGMKFPTDILGEQKDGGVLNFVLGVLGFRDGLKGLHRKYIQEKLDELPMDNVFVSTTFAQYKNNIDTTITHDSAASVWKTCGLTAPDTTIEATIKAKIPTDYIGIKKSLVDNLDTATLNPSMVAKFAPETIITENNKDVVDITKIKDNKDAFVDKYLKYIIPLLADPSDKFINSQNVHQDSFVLAVMGGLVGNKYFIEGVNIGLLSITDFKDITQDTTKNTNKEVVDSSIDLNVINGQIDFSKGKFTDIQKKNINYLINEMKKKNITNPYTQIGILSCIAKESAFIPVSELSYSTTDNNDIRKTFGSRITLSDSELDELKKRGVEEFDKIFFDMVYGKNATAVLGRQTGNTDVGDGYTYRGRGFNGITFKSLYKQYGDLIGEDLVTHPDLLNTPEIAAKVALEYFKKGNDGKELSTLTFVDKQTATKKFTDINAGGYANNYNYQHALAASEKFDVKEKTTA